METEAANTPVMTLMLVLCAAVIRNMPYTQTAERVLVSTFLKLIHICVCRFEISVENSV